MSFTYEEAVQRLAWLGHEGRALKWDLKNIRAVLAALGNPEQAWRSVHIAGTNGKGSVAAMLDSILRAAGYRTGLYTSPHLVRINERIRVAGTEISDREFAAAFTAVEGITEALLARGDLRDHPSFFETLTAMACWHFRETGVEVALLEVGMGGRLDATNVVTSLVSIITQVDFDHERYLGSSLEQIAGEKAGILKPGVPAVIAAAHPAALQIIRERAAAVGAPVVELDADYCAEPVRPRGDGLYEAELMAADGFHLRLAPGLRGRAQVRNAATAAVAARLLNVGGLPLPAEAVVRGIAEVRWPGRLECVGTSPAVYLDGAHNPAAARELLRFWEEECSGRNIHLVFGAMRDKAVEEMADLLFHQPVSVTLTQADSPRAASAEALARLARTLNPRVFVEPDPVRAFFQARALATPQDVVFVAGSLYLVGVVKKALRAQPEPAEISPLAASRPGAPV